MVKVAFAGAFLALFPSSANAQNLVGNDLLRYCNSTQQAEVSFCVGYIVGVVEGIQYGTSVPLMLGGGMDAEEINRLSEAVLMYCPPPEVENSQFVEIAMRYLEANPQNRHGGARLLIHFALVEAFPCLD